MWAALHGAVLIATAGPLPLPPPASSSHVGCVSPPSPSPSAHISGLGADISSSTASGGSGTDGSAILVGLPATTPPSPTQSPPLPPAVAAAAAAARAARATPLLGEVTSPESGVAVAAVAATPAPPSTPIPDLLSAMATPLVAVSQPPPPAAVRFAAAANSASETAEAAAAASAVVLIVSLGRGGGSYTLMNGPSSLHAPYWAEVVPPGRDGYSLILHARANGTEASAEAEPCVALRVPLVAPPAPAGLVPSSWDTWVAALCALCPPALQTAPSAVPSTALAHLGRHHCHGNAVLRFAAAGQEVHSADEQRADEAGARVVLRGGMCNSTDGSQGGTAAPIVVDDDYAQGRAWVPSTPGAFPATAPLPLAETVDEAVAAARILPVPVAITNPFLMMERLSSLPPSPPPRWFGRAAPAARGRAASPPARRGFPASLMP